MRRDADLQVLLDTVDVLRLLTLRGRQEMRELTWWLVVFGLYPAVNIAADVFGGRSFWVETLFGAFWLATVPVAGWGLASATWAIAAGLTYGAYTIVRNLLGFIGILIAVIALGIFVVHFAAVRTGRYRSAQPFKLSIAPKVGWSWGVIMGGMALLQGVLRYYGNLDAGGYAA
ncbi:MAG: hypothetical protein RMK16_11925, partial [Acidobacteriota bacterium]|nr:hypothetical protein [Acidobacteriota bacterium]